MDCATFARKERVVVWLVWLLVLIVAWQRPFLCWTSQDSVPSREVSVVLAATPPSQRFPWWPRWRWRKWALAAHRRWQRARQTAARAARIARLALAGALSLASVVDWLTQCQLQRQLEPIRITDVAVQWWA